ncbi:MAG TPA: hypothetical protein VMK53_04050 [Gemmatimonadales bacterium]|nr:hypothetical protein [Gemmatimonadales bacterium]
MTPESAPGRQVAWALYAIGALLWLAPLADLAAGIGSLNFGVVQWRFGTTGLLASALILPITGLMFWFAAAVILQQRRALQVLFGVVVTMLVLLAVALVLFTLDALQVRIQVLEDVKRAYDLASMKAVLTLASELVVLAVLAVTTFRAAKGTAVRRTSRRSDGAPLVVRAPES